MVEPRLTGIQLQEFQDALLDAYDEEGLQEMVRVRLGRRLDTIVFGHNTRVKVFRLIDWAEKSGYTSDLLNAAKQHNATNPMLIEFAERYPGLFSVNAMGTPNDNVQEDQTYMTITVRGNPSRESLEILLNLLMSVPKGVISISK